MNQSVCPRPRCPSVLVPEFLKTGPRKAGQPFSVMLRKCSGTSSTLNASPCTPSPGHSPASWAKAPTCVCSRGQGLSQPTSLPSGPGAPERREPTQGAAECILEPREESSLTEDACPVGTSGLLPSRQVPLHPHPALSSSHVWETGLRLEAPLLT